MAQALQHKYGRNKEFTVAYSNFAFMGIPYPIEKEVTAVIQGFDKILGQFPTREEVEQAIPVLKGE